MLTIWGRINSINVQKVCWMLAEAGIAHERVDAGMRFGVVGEPWFAALNPNRRVPTLRDGDVVLWESNVILRYLAGRYAPSWLPADVAGRAVVEQWMDWQQTTVMPGLSPLFLGLIRTPAEQRDVAAIEAGGREVEAAMRILDGLLSRSPAVAGDHLTVADIALGPPVYRWLALPVERPALRHLEDWYRRLTERPAFRTHVMLPLT